MLITFLATTLCSCSTSELSQTQTILNADNVAIKSYNVTPTK
jgi:hypothetical protein